MRWTRMSERPAMWEGHKCSVIGSIHQPTLPNSPSASGVSTDKWSTLEYLTLGHREFKHSRVKIETIGSFNLEKVCFWVHFQEYVLISNWRLMHLKRPWQQKASKVDRVYYNVIWITRYLECGDNQMYSCHTVFSSVFAPSRCTCTPLYNAQQGLSNLMHDVFSSNFPTL